jgi:hypothetical protein
MDMCELLSAGQICALMRLSPSANCNKKTKCKTLMQPLQHVTGHGQMPIQPPPEQHIALKGRLVERSGDRNTICFKND